MSKEDGIHYNVGRCPGLEEIWMFPLHAGLFRVWFMAVILTSITVHQSEKLYIGRPYFACNSAFIYMQSQTLKRGF
jgi:hypothetical protein